MDCLAGPVSGQFPHARVELRTATSNEVSELVRRGDMMLGLRYHLDTARDLVSQAVGEEVGQRLPGHRWRLVGRNAELCQQGRLLVLADLVGDGPLVAFLTRLGPQKNLFTAAGAVGPAALFLPAVEANDHAEMALRQGDGVHGRLLDAAGAQ